MNGDRQAALQLRLIEVALAIVVALALGINFGVVNQNTYLLPVVRCLDPQLLAADWLATQTTPYHQAFAGLLCTLGQWIPLDVLSITLNTAMTALGAWCMFVALRLLGSAPSALVASGGVAALAAIMITWETKSAAGSYVFDSYLQPSSLASVFLLFALLAWIRGAAIVCGIALGLCGFFHANFALLAPPAFVLAALLDRELPWRRTLPALLLPAALAFAYHLPTMLAAASGDGAADASRVFQAIRSPHHYDIHVFGLQLAPLAAWTAAGLGLAWFVPASPARRRLCLLLGGMAAIVAGGSLLAALGLRLVIALFPWRLAPFVVLLAQVALMGGIMALLSRPAPSRPLALRLALALAGCAAIVLLVRASYDGSPPATAVAVVTLLPLLAVPAWAWLQPWLTPTRSAMAAWTLLGVAALATAVLIEGVHNLRNSTVWRDTIDADERALYDWTAQTPLDAVFLVPPELENFRLQARRAIVVDWKSTPILPDELQEWYRRIEQVAGRPDVRSRKDAERGYAAMDRARLQALATRYGARYAVFDAEATAAAAVCAPIYGNAHYFVCALEP